MWWASSHHVISLEKSTQVVFSSPAGGTEDRAGDRSVLVGKGCAVTLQGCVGHLVTRRHFHRGRGGGPVPETPSLLCLWGCLRVGWCSWGVGWEGTPRNGLAE